MSHFLDRVGLSRDLALPLARASSEILPADRLQAGHTLRFRARQGRLRVLEYNLDQHRYLRWTRAEEGFRAELKERPRTHQTKTAYGQIQSNLFAAGERAGLSRKLVMEMAKIFGWDIDFAHDLRKGDWFRVLYRQTYRKGRLLADGPILAAQFHNRGHTHHAIRFTRPNGETGYYTYEGRSVRKAFLRSPVEFSRITSGFTRNRDHPILEGRRAHMGVDYAARPGTPVRSTGDGRVTHMGRQGGFGRVVKIRHFNRFTTVYAHLSNFARGVQEGSTVEQGETIGYVGQSGLATGPHLHYEFRLNGRHRNPLKVDLPRAEPLPEGLRPAFRKRRHHLLAWLDQAGPTRLASAEPPGSAQ